MLGNLPEASDGLSPLSLALLLFNKGASEHVGFLGHRHVFRAPFAQGLVPWVHDIVDCNALLRDCLALIGGFVV